MERPRASIMMIPHVDGVVGHLVCSYGQLTAQDVADFVKPFIGQENHQARTMYSCTNVSQKRLMN
jgi:hypothetical protein